ncbi:unnamed protein product [Amoebophrya sp. A120]|nr:unnamed protein product [Amoebophrya sp. A120]|eukprot:GSA120T00015593001.1
MLFSITSPELVRAEQAQLFNRPGTSKVDVHVAETAKMMSPAGELSTSMAGKKKRSLLFGARTSSVFLTVSVTNLRHAGALSLQKKNPGAPVTTKTGKMNKKMKKTVLVDHRPPHQQHKDDNVAHSSKFLPSATLSTAASAPASGGGGAPALSELQLQEHLHQRRTSTSTTETSTTTLVYYELLKDEGLFGRQCLETIANWRFFTYGLIPHTVPADPAAFAETCTAEDCEGKCKSSCAETDTCAAWEFLTTGEATTSLLGGSNEDPAKVAHCRHFAYADIEDKTHLLVSVPVWQQYGDDVDVENEFEKISAANAKQGASGFCVQEARDLTFVEEEKWNAKSFDVIRRRLTTADLEEHAAKRDARQNALEQSLRQEFPDLPDANITEKIQTDGLNEYATRKLFHIPYEGFVNDGETASAVPCDYRRLKDNFQAWKEKSATEGVNGAEVPSSPALDESSYAMLLNATAADLELARARVEDDKTTHYYVENCPYYNRLNHCGDAKTGAGGGGWLKDYGPRGHDNFEVRRDPGQKYSPYKDIRTAIHEHVNAQHTNCYVQCECSQQPLKVRAPRAQRAKADDGTAEEQHTCLEPLPASLFFDLQARKKVKDDGTVEVVSDPAPAALGTSIAIPPGAPVLVYPGAAATAAGSSRAVARWEGERACEKSCDDSVDCAAWQWRLDRDAGEELLPANPPNSDAATSEREPTGTCTTYDFTEVEELFVSTTLLSVSENQIEFRAAVTNEKKVLENFGLLPEDYVATPLNDRVTGHLGDHAAYQARLFPSPANAETSRVAQSYFLTQPGAKSCSDSGRIGGRSLPRDWQGQETGWWYDPVGPLVDWSERDEAKVASTAKECEKVGKLFADLLQGGAAKNDPAATNSSKNVTIAEKADGLMCQEETLGKEIPLSCSLKTATTVPSDTHAPFSAHYRLGDTRSLIGAGFVFDYDAQYKDVENCISPDYQLICRADHVETTQKQIDIRQKKFLPLRSTTYYSATGRCVKNRFADLPETIVDLTKAEDTSKFFCDYRLSQTAARDPDAVGIANLYFSPKDAKKDFCAFFERTHRIGSIGSYLQDNEFSFSSSADEPEKKNAAKKLRELLQSDSKINEPGIEYYKKNCGCVSAATYVDEPAKYKFFVSDLPLAAKVAPLKDAATSDQICLCRNGVPQYSETLGKCICEMCDAGFTLTADQSACRTPVVVGGHSNGTNASNTTEEDAGNGSCC